MGMSLIEDALQRNALQYGKEEKNKYKIDYKVGGVEYNFGTASDEPNIVLALRDFKFCEGNTSVISNDALLLYLNKSTFNKLTDYFWNGTPEDCKRIKKDLEGRVFTLDLGMRKENDRCWKQNG